MPEQIRCPSCGFANVVKHNNCVKCGTTLPHEPLYQKLLKKWKNITQKEEISEIVSEFKTSIGATLKNEDNERFTILKTIGSGSYGEVLLVENTKTKQQFAAKLLRMWHIAAKERKGVENRFLQEYKVAKMAKDVGSPFLVHALSKGYANGNPFFVMEYCSGGSLRDNIRNRFADHEIKNVAVSVLKGLMALHGQGIVHRDLKPENILFQQGQVKLTDFGISGYLNSRMTKTNFDGSIKFTLGTDVYIPPEQFDRSNAFKTMGSVTDIFAFGVVMFEMITNGQFPYGSPPEYDDKNPEQYNQVFEQYCQRVRNNDYELLNDLRDKLVPDFWADVIEKCIVADYKKRANNVEELLTEIMQYQRNSSNVAVAEPTAKPAYLAGSTYLLRVMNGWQPNLVFNLSAMMPARGYLTIGRFDEDEPELNDIGVIEDEDPYFISRYQSTFEVVSQSGNWYIRDGQYRKIGSKPQWVASKNGTFVNSIMADTKGIRLKAGDIITIGDTTLRVEREELSFIG